MTGIPDDGQVSDEARVMADQVRARAAGLPLGEGLAGIATDAIGHGAADMTPTEIRALATEAIVQAQKVSYLLGRLAGLLDEPGGRDGL